MKKTAKELCKEYIYLLEIQSNSAWINDQEEYARVYNESAEKLNQIRQEIVSLVIKADKNGERLGSPSSYLGSELCWNLVVGNKYIVTITFEYDSEYDETNTCIHRIEEIKTNISID